VVRYYLIALILIHAVTSRGVAQDLNAVRDDQINRLRDYVVAAIRPSGLVRDSVVLHDPNDSFHPATPDAAGFALVALSALDHLGKLPDAEQRVADILSAYAGQTPGVAPDRSADGHFIHFMNVDTGAPAPCCWDDSYTPIGTALLVAGAQFARNHFPDNGTIASLTDQLTHSVNFNHAIHPNLDGRIYLDMTTAGGGAGETVGTWNEFMLVESLALREDDNSRALAVKHRWLDTEFIPKRSFNGIPTLTDNPDGFAPAFWVQQMQFFNGDFRHSDEFQTFFTNQQQADQLYSMLSLGEEFRYGLTAGLVPSPVVYHADRIGVDDTFDDHPFNVFSPEAVAAWGDMDTLLQFYAAQDPTSDLSYQFGLVRVSGQQPSWIPQDAGLVDHLFLLFGLVESLDPNFFADRVFAPLAPSDFNADGTVGIADYQLWKSRFGSTTHLAADGNSDGIVDAADYTIWRDQLVSGGASALAAVPEPAAAVLVIEMWLVVMAASGFHWFSGHRTRGRVIGATAQPRQNRLELRNCPDSAWERGTVPILLRESSPRMLRRAKWGQSPALSGQFLSQDSARSPAGLGPAGESENLV
jgi:hypothetical protein